MKYMKQPITLLTCIVAATSLQGVELITSDGAWTETAVNATSNAGQQSNSNTSGAFSRYDGASYNTNSEAQYMDMQTTASNVQQNYTAGYTYTYTGNARRVADFPNQVASLTADGSVVTGTRITAATGNGSWAPNTGTYTVDTGNTAIGKAIGLRLSSEGSQSRFSANSVNPSSTVSALLTNHDNTFDYGNGSGALHSTAFSDGAQTTAFDHVLDMALSSNGGGFNANYYRINNNTTDRNQATFGSATDTFRTGTSYEITFDANQAIIADAGQTSVDIILGGGSYTETVTMSGTRDTYTMTVDADANGLEGQAFDFQFIASDTTSSGVNQYRIYSFDVAAIPEPNSYSLLAGAFALTWIMVRRRK